MSSVNEEVRKDFDVFMDRLLGTLVHHRGEQIQKDIWDKLTEDEKRDIALAFYRVATTNSEALMRGQSWNPHIRGEIRNIVDSVTRKAVRERYDEMGFQDLAKTMLREALTKENFVAAIDKLLAEELEKFRKDIVDALANVKAQIRNHLY